MMHIEYIYILRTWDSASADTQYKLTQKDDKNNYNWKSQNSVCVKTNI